MDPSVVIQTPSDQLITFLSLSIAYFCFSVQFAFFSLNVSVDFRKNVKRYKLHIFAHLEFIPQFQLFSASQNPRRSHFTFFLQIVISRISLLPNGFSGCRRFILTDRPCSGWIRTVDQQIADMYRFRCHPSFDVKKQATIVFLFNILVVLSQYPFES